MKILQSAFKFVKRYPVFILLSIGTMSCVEWHWTNVKSFLTGVVIAAGITFRIMTDADD